VAEAVNSFSGEVTSASTSVAAYFDADGVLQPSVVTDTELGYLDGVTSAIQTQISALAAGFTTETQVLVVRGADVTTQNINNAMFFGEAVTITRVTCITDTGTVELNVENGANDVLTAELVCDIGEQDACASGCDVDTIDDDNSYDDFAANSWLDLSISATASDPGQVSIAVTYTIQ
jgi:hypothetical protein